MRLELIRGKKTTWCELTLDKKQLTIQTGGDGVDTKRRKKTFLTSAKAKAAQEAKLVELTAEGYRDPLSPGDPPPDLARDAGLEAAIRANRDDAGTYSVYADWLQQHDNPLGQLLVHSGAASWRGAVETFSLQGLDLPELRELVVETCSLSKERLAAIVVAKLPKLAKLELWFGSEGYGATASIKGLTVPQAPLFWPQERRIPGRHHHRGRRVEDRAPARVALALDGDDDRDWRRCADREREGVPEAEGARCHRQLPVDRSGARDQEGISVRHRRRPEGTRRFDRRRDPLLRLGGGVIRSPR